MRTSLVLLVVLAACSDASSPRQLPVLTTRLSSSVVSVSEPDIIVTLLASNPTDTTLHLTFDTPTVSAEIKLQGQWTGGGTPGISNLDTLSVGPGAVDSVGSADLRVLLLSAGNYDVRACYDPLSGPSCASSVTLTVTP